MYKNTKLAKAVRFAIVFGALASTTISKNTLAAEPEEAVERISVTGSRIQREGVAAPSPVTVITAENIKRSGAVTIGDLINELPALGNTQTLASGSGNDAGLVSLDLRNLGTNRTLVLVNGKRHVAGTPGSSAVDTNSIPVAWIERVEILTGGASAVYGADAVTGVVNFILKDHFEGAEFNVQKGKASGHGFKQDLISFTVGSDFNDGKGNAAVSFEYSQQNKLMLTDRKFGRTQYSSVPNPANKNDSNEDTAAGIPDSIYVANAGWADDNWNGMPSPWYIDTPMVFNQDGSIRPQNMGTLYGNYKCGPAADGTPCDFLKLNEYETIQPKFDRFAFNSILSYQLNDDHRLYTEAKYNKSDTFHSTQPAFFEELGGTFPLIIKEDNPYLHQTTKDWMQGLELNEFTMHRWGSDLTRNASKNIRETTRFVAGIKGVIAQDWDYDLFALKGRTSQTEFNPGSIHSKRFLQSVDAVKDTEGNIICRSNLGLADEAKSGCVPTSVFGYGSINAQASDWFTTTAVNSYDIVQTVVGGTFANSALAELPAGDLAIAGGFEYRKETSKSTPDAMSRTGLLWSVESKPDGGSYDVNEAFVEVSIPLLADMTLVDNLIVDVAGRYSDYSTIGGTFTWKAGLSWEVNEELKLRATRSRAVRAPNIAELFAPSALTFHNGVKDPCDAVEIKGSAPDKAVREANCKALGAWRVDGFDPVQDNASVPGTASGNPDLKEETSDSLTAGVVWANDDFSITVDYWDMKLEDAIASVSAQTIADRCVDDTGGIDNQFCKLVTRDAQGEFSGIATKDQNLQAMHASGIDFETRYSFIAFQGEVSAGIIGTYLIENVEFPFQSDPSKKESHEGIVGLPELSINLTLGYRIDKVGISWQTRFLDSQLDASKKEILDTNPDFQPRAYQYTGSVAYHDLQADYSFDDNLTVYLNINNLTDKGMPKPWFTGNGTDAIFDNIGRMYSLGMTYKF